MIRLLCFSLLLVSVVALFIMRNPQVASANDQAWWRYQVIDTMKLSRDLARAELKNPQFDATIQAHLREIAAAGATHVAIGTPYDEEFLPYMRRWVKAARQENLKIWFRGNFSGWEGWFEYAKIGREQHKVKLSQFILNNPDLFENGDLFSACPECENGGPGDPRKVGDVEEHRQFLIEEYQLTQQAFRSIGKNVQSNMASMNGDVARLIMDEETTKALGGIIVVDHYVKDPATLAADVKDYARRSKGKVILGEFGAPIPDIHGSMSEQAQAKWIDSALSQLSLIPELVGINYWVGSGGSTALFNSDGSAREALGVLKSFFSPPTVSGTVVDLAGKPLEGVTVKSPYRLTTTDSAGAFSLALSQEDTMVSVFAPGFHSQSIPLVEGESLSIVMAPEKEPGIFERILESILRLLGL